MFKYFSKNGFVKVHTQKKAFAGCVQTLPNATPPIYKINSLAKIAIYLNQWTREQYSLFKPKKYLLWTLNLDLQPAFAKTAVSDRTQ